MICLLFGGDGECLNDPKGCWCTTFYCDTQPVKPPLGLRPRKFADEARMKEILEAMTRYVAEGKKIPNDWLLEFDELNEGLEE